MNMTKFLIIAIGFAMTCVSHVEADSVESFKGVTFTVPSRFVEVQADPPASKVWINEDDKLSIALVSMPVKGEANADEYYDWPAAGRAMVAGAGQRQVKMLESATGAKCRFEGSPMSRVLQRMAMMIELTVSCDTEPVTALRLHMITAVTPTDQVMIRIDSEPGSPYAEGVAGSIWNSLENPTAPFRAEKVRPSDTSINPVQGGSGFRLRDYELVAFPYLIGEMIGGILAALTIGALLVLLFMRLGMKPFASVILSQVVLTAFRIWMRNVADGVWELDWMVLVPSAAFGVSGLQHWAQRRWDRKVTRVAQT